MKYFLGFSGTVATSMLIKFETEFKDSFNVTIPSLRTGGTFTKMSNV